MYATSYMYEYTCTPHSLSSFMVFSMISSFYLLFFFHTEDTGEPAFDGSLKAVYINSCKNNNVIPASYFLRHMEDMDLEMKHHGLGPNGIKPLAIALVVRKGGFTTMSIN